jgi:hypothetical protein
MIVAKFHQNKQNILFTGKYRGSMRKGGRAISPHLSPTYYHGYLIEYAV